MPEGPELRTSADHLNRILLGKKLINCFPHKSGRYAKQSPEGHGEFLDKLSTLGPPQIIEINVKGKFMYWTFQFPDDDDVWSLWVTHPDNRIFLRAAIIPALTFGHRPSQLLQKVLKE